MSYNFKVGDTIFYGDKNFPYEDIIEKNEKTKKFYGRFLTNNAHSEEFDSIEDLINSYINYWENVKISSNGKEHILKDFKRDINEIKNKGNIIFSKNLTENIKIEILKIKIKTFYEKERSYYLEFQNNELIDYKRISL